MPSRLTRHVAASSLILLACLASGPAGAQAPAAPQPAAAPAPVPTTDQAILQTARWRSIGPDRGGRSIAVGGVKGRPREAYFGAVGGGLWKTDRRRQHLGAGDRRPDHAARRSARSPSSESNPDVVYIGMGESCIRGNIMPGDGVYKSTDAGKTWTNVGFRNADAISKIRIHPTNPDIVFVAGFGQYSGPSDERGVFKSSDGGKTWKRVLFRDAKTGAVDLVDRSQEPQRDLRVAVGGVPHRIPDVERRPGQRPLQVHRRRRDLDRDHAQSGHARGHGRPDRRRGLGRRREPRLRAGRERERRALRRPTTPARRGS